MFDSFRDSARIAQTKKDSEGVTAKTAFGALLAAAVVFAVQLKASDTSAVSRFAYAVVTWLVTYLGWPLAEFGWNYMRAALRIAGRPVDATSGREEVVLGRRQRSHVQWTSDRMATSDYSLTSARLLRLSNRKIHRKQQRLGGTSIAIAEVCL